MLDRTGPQRTAHEAFFPSFFFFFSFEVFFFFFCLPWKMSGFERQACLKIPKGLWSLVRHSIRDYIYTVAPTQHNPWMSRDL